MGKRNYLENGFKLGGCLVYISTKLKRRKDLFVMEWELEP